jgi:iron complex outermembrane receptor protein
LKHCYERTGLRLGAAVLALAAASAPALGQTSLAGATAGSQTTEETRATSGAPPENLIVVTGSRIARAGFDTVQPALVVDAEQIETRGYTNISEALDALPAFGVPDANVVGLQSSFGPGQTFVDFFSLGSQRTLTLVNGRRFVSSNTASIFGPVDSGSQVDLNVIPTKLIDRVETVAVGGAPIYGSDAIAGTVNFILKRDYEGIELDAQQGLSSRGDAREYRIRGLAGQNFAGGRGNITVSGEYVKSDGLVYNDRRQTREARFFVSSADPNSPFAQVLIRNRRLPSLSQFGVPLTDDFIPLSPSQVVDLETNPNVQNAAGQALAFDPAGNLVPIDFGQGTGDLTVASGGSGFSLADVSSLQAETERYLATALVSYELTDNVRLFGEGWYSNTKGVNLVDQPVYNTALFDEAGGLSGNIVVPLSNPFLSPAARETIAASLDLDGDGVPDSDSFYLGRANTDLYSGRAEGEVELFRFVGGLDGTLELGDRTYSWELAANYGRSKARGRIPELVQQNFLNATDVVLDPAGNIICRPGAASAPIETLSSTCAPLNLFGQQVSPEAAAYITTIARPRSVNEQRVLTASVTGPLFTLPGGEVSMALGYENRREETDFDPGDFYELALGRSIPITPIGGSFTTNEIFGELLIPIVSADMDVPFVSLLEVQGAGRWVDHSIAGSDFTWTAGGRYAPIPDLTFRGNFTRSIRSPAITEAFSPTAQAFDTADDPCDASFVNSGPNPATRAANCAAGGLPPDFQSNIVEFTSEISVAGNPDLENEKADSWTVGAVLRPSAVPNLTLAVDWVDIKLTNAVVTLDAEQTMEACYDAAEFPNDFCGRIDRDAAGQVTFIRTGYVNAARLDFEGLTTELAWSIPVPALGANSSVTLAGNYLYVKKLEERVGTGDIDTIRGEIGDPRHSFTASITYADERFTWQVEGEYFGKSNFNSDDDVGARDISGVGDVMFINTSLGFRATDNMTLRLIVDNLLDTDPPYPAPAGGAEVSGVAAYYSGVLGRYFRLGASVRF